jgi:hypothetical protein
LPDGVLEDNIRLLAFSSHRHGIFKLFEKVSGYAMMAGPNISPYWREHCYREFGWSFLPYTDDAKMYLEGKKWLGTSTDTS